MNTIRHLGRAVIPDSIGPTFQAFTPALRAHKASIEYQWITPQTFTYGPHARHRLDLYEPPTDPAHSPILLFIPGGGMVSGDRTLKDIPDELVYNSVGNFFAHGFGFNTLIMDYRLIQHGSRFEDGGGEDVDLAMRWICKSYCSAKMYILANSAGAIHAATWLFDPRFSEHRRDWIDVDHDGPKLEKVAFLSGGLRLRTMEGMRETLNMYYGSERNIAKYEPMELMRRAETDISSMPTILSVFCEFDPTEIVAGTGEFAALWRAFGGKGAMFCLPGHNHISPPVALGTGLQREEAWGRAVGEWFLGTSESVAKEKSPKRDERAMAALL